jgi:hypothetical protein
MSLSRSLFVIVALAAVAAAVVFLLRGTRPKLEAIEGMRGRQESTIDRSDDEALPKPGPIDRGLCLRLAIGPTGEDDSRPVRLDCLNTSTEPVTLVAEWSYGSTYTYAEFFESRVKLTSVPETTPYRCQYGTPGDPTAPKPSTTIRPGESLTVALAGTARSLSSRYRCDGVAFRSPGLYYVRANVDLFLADGSRVRLWSNECEYVVGNDRRKPKVQIAHVTERGKDPRSVTLDLGRDDGVEQGDRYAWPNMAYRPQYEVVEVGAKTSVARMVHFSRPLPQGLEGAEDGVLPKDARLEYVAAFERGRE